MHKSIALSDTEFLIKTDINNLAQCKINGAIEQIAFTIKENEIIEIDLNIVTHLSQLNIWYITNIDIGDEHLNLNEVEYDILYVALYLYSLRMNSKIVWCILRYLDDKKLIEIYKAIINKQDHINFIFMVKNAIFDKRLRCNNNNIIKNENLISILDLLALLSNDDNNKIIINKFNFNIKNDYDLEFICDSNEEFAFKNLIFSEDKLNVSINITKYGYVDLTHINKFINIPNKFITFITRTLSLIKNGNYCIQHLNVSLSETTFKFLLHKAKLINFKQQNNKFIGCIDLHKLPIINYQQLKTIDVKEIFELQWQLEIAKSFLKTIKFYNNFKNTFETLYGINETIWLKSVGINSSGFQIINKIKPNKDLNDSDSKIVFMIRGLSTSSNINKVIEKINNNKKLNLNEQLIHNAIIEINNKDITWIKNKYNELNIKIFELIRKINYYKFMIFIGKCWFNEISIDEFYLNFKLNSQIYNVLCSIKIEVNNAYKSN